MNPFVAQVTQNIAARSAQSRAAYIELMQSQRQASASRNQLSCCNIAHGLASLSKNDKAKLANTDNGNIAIVTAYNDLLSAHQPYAHYPEEIKQALLSTHYTAQVAAGVPAMCDGITQGNSGMELSLFSRDLIAMSTAIGLTHSVFDGIICLGICDKIVPGLLIGALRFGHLPCVFIPAGPMTTGISNRQKAHVRQQYAEGNASRADLLASESQAYHSPGTCTFYGTANTNQILLEAMGLQLPGSSFINPGTSLRQALTRHAVLELIKHTPLEASYQPLYQVVDAKALTNAMVALLASGGSTNHTLHLVAIGYAAGLQITWDDFALLSQTVPLLTSLYPNGEADVNDFQQAGGTSRLFEELIKADLMYTDNQSFNQHDFSRYALQPSLINDSLSWENTCSSPMDENIIRPANRPFQQEGGLKIISGNIGTGIIKTSALNSNDRVVKAPARVFTSQQQLEDAFKNGELYTNFIAVIIYQGPKANGMPELHKLTPLLASIMAQGFKVGLVTDGRMSGASGKVPAAIHITPEAKEGGNIAKIHDGDILTLNAETGEISVALSEQELAARPCYILKGNESEGLGRELFALFRNNISAATEGATIFSYSE